MAWHRTDNLKLDDEGILSLVTGEDDVRLGHVEHCANKAFDLGLEAEYDEHLDLWQDSGSCDYAGQVRSDYYQLQGN